MDILGGERRKKVILISLGVFLFIVLLVSLIFILSNGDSEGVENQEGVSSDESVGKNGESDGVGGWTSSEPIDTGYSYSGGSGHIESSVPVFYGGRVASYQDLNTHAEFELNIGGDESRKQKFTITKDSFVFDTEKNKVVVPSKISEASDIRVVAVGDATAGNRVVELVILNDRPEIDYTEVDEVVLNEDKSMVVRSNKRDMEYIVPSDVVLKNALNGEPLDKGYLAPTDKLVFYTSESKGDRKIEVSDVYVYLAVGVTRN